MSRRNSVEGFVESHFNLIATLGIFLAFTASANELASGLLGHLLAIVFCGASIVVWLEVLALMGEPQGGTLQPVFVLLAAGCVLFCLYELKLLIDQASRLAWVIPWIALLAVAGRYVDNIERAWLKWGLPKGALTAISGLYLLGSAAALISWVNPRHLQIWSAWLRRWM